MTTSRKHYPLNPTVQVSACHQPRTVL